METLQFLAAGMVSALWCGVHLVLGGREVARPLRQAEDMAPLVRDVLYLCWHLTTVAIASMAVFFLMAYGFAQEGYAVAGTMLAAGFTLVGIIMTTAIKQSHVAMPQGWLFLPVTALGLWGLLVD